MVYVATPHQFHAAQAALAAAAGKHVLVEKPMALSLAECAAMTATARAHGVHLIIGHSHSFDAPVALARKLIEGGAYGRLRMITAVNSRTSTGRDGLRARYRAAEAWSNQAAHHVDIARLLGGTGSRACAPTPAPGTRHGPLKAYWRCLPFRTHFRSLVIAVIALVPTSSA